MAFTGLLPGWRSCALRYIVRRVMSPSGLMTGSCPGVCVAALLVQSGVLLGSVPLIRIQGPSSVSPGPELQLCPPPLSLASESSGKTCSHLVTWKCCPHRPGQINAPSFPCVLAEWVGPHLLVLLSFVMDFCVFDEFLSIASLVFLMLKWSHLWPAGYLSGWLPCPFDTVSVVSESLLALLRVCPGLVLSVFCFSLGISCFSKDPGSFWWRVVSGAHSLRNGGAHCYGGLSAPGLFSRQNEEIRFKK